MISFLDLKKINEKHTEAFLEKTKNLLHSGWYVLGTEVSTFENNYANYCNAKFCIGVGNGLDALILILKAHLELGNLKKGDHVIVQANTYIASILAILHVDLVPVFIEPNIDTFLIDYDFINDKITSKTKAIMVVHLYGQLTDMNRINDIAHKKNLIIIEDAAQSHGTKRNHSSVPKNSILTRTAAAHSFYPSKNLGALGDAGAITTDNKALTDTIKLLRNYGSNKKYFNEIVGFNSRLDEIQAAFLNVKLPFLDAENKFRQHIAIRYLQEINNPKIKLPTWNQSVDHVFHLFVILTAERQHFMDYMARHHIETMIHYPVAPHKQTALKQFETQYLPITEKIHSECVSLPISPVLTNEAVSKIIHTINNY